MKSRTRKSFWLDYAALPTPIRISASYRAVGIKTPANTIVWFFIGTHADYDRLLASL